MMRIAAAAAVAMACAGVAAGAETSFDIDQRLNAVVAVEALVPADARSAGTLGTERLGNGVVIDDGDLVLTIGYVVLEAFSVVVKANDGRRLPAEILLYDYDTGFGLLRPIRPLDIAPMPLAESAAAREGDPVLIAGAGGRGQAVPGLLTARREFAGYWEYLLDEALFAAPPHPNWGGAALIDRAGGLLGIGSLFVPDARPGRPPQPGNMFVPIDLLKPLLAGLKAGQDVGRSGRPWLGLYSAEADGKVVVARLAEGGPAAAAGLQAGDVVAAVDGRRITGMADMYRRIWSLGKAGVEVPLTVQRGGADRAITVRSGDRYDYLKLDPTF